MERFISELQNRNPQKDGLQEKKKQREAKIGKHVGSKHWGSKKVINLDTGEVFESIGLVAKELKIINGSHIVDVCKGKKQRAYGYRWAYYEKGGDAKC